MKRHEQTIGRCVKEIGSLVENETDACLGCLTFEKFKEKTIRESDSVFDAIIDAQDFCEKCCKTCVKRVDK